MFLINHTCSFAFFFLVSNRCNQSDIRATLPIKGVRLDSTDGRATGGHQKRLAEFGDEKKNTANEKLMILEKVVRAIQKYEDTARGKLVSNDKAKSSELEKQ